MDKLLEKHKLQLEKLDKKHSEQKLKLKEANKKRQIELGKKHKKERDMLLKKQKEEIKLFNEAIKKNKSILQLKKEKGLVKPKTSKLEKAKEIGFDTVEEYDAFKVIMKETNKEIKSIQKELAKLFKELNKNQEKFNVSIGKFSDANLQQKYEKASQLSDKLNELIKFKTIKESVPLANVPEVPEIEEEFVNFEDIPLGLTAEEFFKPEVKQEINLKKSDGKKLSIVTKKGKISAKDIKTKFTPEEIKKKQVKTQVKLEETEKAKKALEELFNIPEEEMEVEFIPLPDLPKINMGKDYSKKEVKEFEDLYVKAMEIFDSQIDRLDEKEAIDYANKLGKFEENISVQKERLSMKPRKLFIITKKGKVPVEKFKTKFSAKEIRKMKKKVVPTTEIPAKVVPTKEIPEKKTRKRIKTIDLPSGLTMGLPHYL